jgi:hypothetical protein
LGVPKIAQPRPKKDMRAIALSGPLLSGKSSVARIVGARSGRTVVSFGDYVRSEGRKRGGVSDRGELQALGRELLHSQGPLQFCKSAAEAASVKVGPRLIWDGVRHPEVLTALNRLHGGELDLVYLNPPSGPRIERALAAAGSRSVLEAWESDETEQHHSELMAAADLCSRAESVVAAAADVLALGAD